MIPTQPEVPNPFEPNSSWRPTNTFKGYQCPYCLQWIADAQLHNCSGPTFPLRADTNVDWPGMITDVTMYSDFKKLFKRDTLAKFRERFIGSIEDDNMRLPDDEQPLLLGLDAIVELFDNVASGFHDDSSL